MIEKIIKLNRIATNFVKFIPFVISLVYILFYIYAEKVPEEIDLSILMNQVHSPIYLTLSITILAYLLKFCFWHIILCLMPFCLDLLLFAGEYGYMNWASDLTYTNIIIGLFAWSMLTAFICYKNGWFRKCKT